MTDPKLRRFRYGVQVNSLGLTESQPENNVQRIVLEMLGVTLSRDARARAIQLPAWNEALGLPRPWDQQWSLRIQQVLAFETDLLEYPDLFDGSPAIERVTNELVRVGVGRARRRARAGRGVRGGRRAQAPSGWRARPIASSRIESGDLKVIGVNCFTESEPSPLAEGLDGADSVLKVDPAVEAELVTEVAAWRTNRDARQVRDALDALRRAAEDESANIMPRRSLSLTRGARPASGPTCSARCSGSTAHRPGSPAAVGQTS